MARPKKDAPVNLAERVSLTVGTIERLTCPEGKQQAFLRDSEVPGLRVRVTSAGAKAFVYEAKLNRQTIRRTIGDVRSWTIEQARTEARRLAVTLDAGQDPREIERQQQATRAAQKAAAAVKAITVAEAWAVYLADRRQHWGGRHYQDHEKLSSAGGEISQRGTRGRGVTIAGPLHPLMAMRLQDLTAPVIEEWAAKQAKARPTPARLSWRLLRAFLAWCLEHPQYAAVVQA